MNINSKFRRVDIQVSILTAFIVMISFICVYYFNYRITYQDMIKSLSERAVSIHEYVEKNLDKSTFRDINSVEDQSKQSYIDTKKLLEDVKGTTGVMYLYTAKQSDDGSLIYVVDGLDSNSPDIRNAGDMIEKEIWGDLFFALDGNKVLPNKIKETSWGYIFISYFPVHDNGKVVGVVGIEFEAGHQYRAFQLLRFGTPIIAFITCLISILIAVKLFKRISNPLYQDFANTDYLTGVKNRNAFELDMNNLKNSTIREKLDIISIDLNNLKKINDSFGHKIGDDYIKYAAEIINKNISKSSTLYRVGGDEFVIISKDVTSQQIEKSMNKIMKNCEQINKETYFTLSMAVGYATFDLSKSEDIFETYQRADNSMYENKKAMKMSK